MNTVASSLRRAPKICKLFGIGCVKGKRGLTSTRNFPFPNRSRGFGCFNSERSLASWLFALIASTAGRVPRFASQDIELLQSGHTYLRISTLRSLTATPSLVRRSLAISLRGQVMSPLCPRTRCHGMDVLAGSCESTRPTQRALLGKPAASAILPNEETRPGGILLTVSSSRSRAS